jgi:hypothetical protein
MREALIAVRLITRGAKSKNEAMRTAEEFTMRTLCGSMAVIFSLVMLSAVVFADERGGRGGGGVGPAISAGGGTGGSVHANVEGNHSESAHVNNNEHVNGNEHLNVDGNRENFKANVNSNVEHSNRDFVRNNNNFKVNRNDRLGDNNFDRRGVGRLDASRFANERNDNWRFRRWGNEWWYWLPTGSWAYWRGDRWYPYNYDSYVDYNDYQNQAPVANNFNGPYYEDQNGFYYLEGNQRVYDPQIRRVGGEVGTLPGPYSR